MELVLRPEAEVDLAAAQTIAREEVPLPQSGSFSGWRNDSDFFKAIPKVPR